MKRLVVGPNSTAYPWFKVKIFCATPSFFLTIRLYSLKSFFLQTDTGSNAGSNGADGDQAYDLVEDIAKMKVGSCHLWPYE